MGLRRMTPKTYPDQYPAEKELLAEPVKGDNKDMALIRPLLKQTELGAERTRIAVMLRVVSTIVLVPDGTRS